MYFSSMPRGDWPRGVDARPPTQPEEDDASASSESRGTDAGRTESLPLVSEKTRGKRAATDELAQKRRKMAAVAPLESVGISLGGDQITRMRRITVIERSDNEEILVAPLPSTKAPPRSQGEAKESPSSERWHLLRGRQQESPSNRLGESQNTRQRRSQSCRQSRG